MKTIEQAGKDYAGVTEDKWHNQSHIYTPLDMLDAFEAGAKFAQEWINPMDEMPPVGELVQVKVKWRDDSDITYDHDKRTVGNGYDDFEINQMVGLEVVGWRPIERK